MNVNKISDDLYISSQITPEEVHILVEMGVKSIVCNRPDGESADQPTFEAIQAAVQPFHIQAIHQPVVGSSITPLDGKAFGEHIQQLPKPVFAYCRSGQRCLMLYNLSQEDA